MPAGVFYRYLVIHQPDINHIVHGEIWVYPQSIQSASAHLLP